MVSLNREESTAAGSGGGVFFSASSLNSTETDSDTQYLLQPINGSENLKKFTPLNTIYATVSFFLLTVMMEAVVIFFTFWPVDPNFGGSSCPSYFVTLYSHNVYWSFSFLLHVYYLRKHHELRVRGYLEIYQKIHHISRMPFYLTSSFNALFLGVSLALHEVYGDMSHHCIKTDVVTPITYICLVTTLETFLMTIFLVIYIRRVAVFNRSKAFPDAQRDDWLANFVRDSYSAGEVGYREKDNPIEDLLEKQADLMRYLREENWKLRQKLWVMINMLRQKNNSSQIT